MSISNWAGNYTYSAARFHAPETVEQLQELVRRSTSCARSAAAIRSMASPTPPRIRSRWNISIRCCAIDRERNTVTVEAGIKYGQLGQYLHGQGYALHNMASLPHISVAGACATATHGSGDGNGNLATAVAAIEMVTANGDLVVLSREQRRRSSSRARWLGSAGWGGHENDARHCCRRLRCSRRCTKTCP